MSDQPSPATVLLAGAGRRFSVDIRRRLERDGYRVLSVDAVTPSAVEAALAETADLDAIVINAAGAVGGASFLTLADEAFVGRLHEFLDLVGALQGGLARLREGGAIVALTSRGHLGAWGGVDEMAFSAATVGLIRSLSLEDTPRGVRANVVASDFAPEDFGGDRREPPDRGERVAGTVAFLLGDDAQAITGEVLLANAGRSLQRREARDRRSELDAQDASLLPSHDRTFQR